VSSYIKLIIFVVVLLLISVAIVFIDSSLDNINESMPSISDGIVQGDKDYNESVELLNSRYFEQSREKAISAGDNYNESLEKLEKIQDKYDKDLNDVHKEYIDTTINELKLKIKAVDELKEAIYYLEIYYNYTGSSHGTQANDLMYSSLTYQNERNEIVQENPELFT
jgi:predicted PurR-regulated permease PerM